MTAWKKSFRRKNTKEHSTTEKTSRPTSSSDLEDGVHKPPKWSFGVLNDKQTDEVPGSVILLSKYSKQNEPLGLQYAPARTSSSSLPSPYPPGYKPLSRTSTGTSARKRSERKEKKKTPDGKFVLEPQPEDSHNDPLNWPLWRRNAALLSLGYYCMLGGGMTPILAAGFNNVAATYNVSVPRVALTTGLYMMGLGVGCVIMSPTAILYGKRPVYLATAVAFILSNIWCALSPNYTSLVVARIFQGIAVSPVECLPSATVAEIFFLHERAYRLGIYTLLLLGGKNLVPLVSAAIIESMGWRWVFWIFAMLVGFGWCLLFLFLGETFWDRTPRARTKSEFHLHLPHLPHLPQLPHIFRSHSIFGHTQGHADTKVGPSNAERTNLVAPEEKRRQHLAHVAFEEQEAAPESSESTSNLAPLHEPSPVVGIKGNADKPDEMTPISAWKSPVDWDVGRTVTGVPDKEASPIPVPDLHNLNSPWYEGNPKNADYFSMSTPAESSPPTVPESEQAPPRLSLSIPETPAPVLRLPISRRNTNENPTTVLSERKKSTELQRIEDEPGDQLAMPPEPLSALPTVDAPNNGDVSPTDKLKYTDFYRTAPPKTYLQTLKPYSGRLTHDKWLHVAIRPFILYAYPSILWSAVVYSLSVGWLIVLSESVSTIYKNRDTYHFTSLQTGLVYISPFIGGILGTAVAGKLSDLVVRFMARRNDGVYEPEFRLVMGIPVAITTTIGLMGFGWSAQERDNFMVPTVFFGIISFGCSLGSTTSITFAVDSYRQYAGEALVTLNFSKNIFHGLVFSLFFPKWLESDGSKDVFIALGGIQLFFLLFTIPMFIYGKRARMWTVRKNLMENF